MFKLVFRFLRTFFFRNSSPSQTVVKNTAWLFSGEVLGRFIRFILVIYSARILGVGEYGVFSYALSLAALLTLLADFGIGPMLTREASKHQELRATYFSTAFVLKILLLLITVLLTIFIVPFITRLEAVSVFLPMVLLLFVFDSLREFSFGMNRALEHMQHEALTKIFLNVVVVVLGFFVLYTSPSATSLLWAYVIGAGLSLALTILILWQYVVRIFSSINWSLIPRIIAISWPIGLLQVLGALMLNTDMIMLGWWETEVTIGLYAGANKIILLLYVLPNLIAAAAFPVFSRLAQTDKRRFRFVFEKIVAGTFLLSIPLTIGGLLTAPALIEFLYHAEYAGSVTTFMILLPTLLIVFPSTVFSNALFAFNEQRRFLFFVFLGVMSNIILNILLIPEFSIAGVAVATVGSQLLTNFFVWRAMGKVSQFSVLPHIYKMGVSALCMGGVLFFFTTIFPLPFLATVVLGMSTYAGFLFLFREELLFEVLSIIKKRLHSA